MAGNEDFQAHERTYFSIMSLLKWGTIIAVLVTALVVWLIS